MRRYVRERLRALGDVVDECLVRYDLRSASRRCSRAAAGVELARFVALRSHYLYESGFTRIGKEGAHEKGGVEGEVGRFRRSHLVPVPEVATLAELNASCCELGAWPTSGARFAAAERRSARHSRASWSCSGRCRPSASTRPRRRARGSTRRRS